jgi:diadenosine tetraphosphate (Ap4A) HIT family hydrolase
MNEPSLRIKSYTYWQLHLHPSSSYLGRTYLLLKDNQLFEDFLSIEGVAREEFFDIGNSLKRALQLLFQPDKMNVAALSNTCEKIHVHFIPRYKESRHYHGREFKDLRWGKNYAPYDPDCKLEEALTTYLIKDLQEKLSLNP